MKASFSMSSLRDGINQEDESGGTPATLPRRKNLDVIRHYVEKSQKKRDEFWEALQPNYDYLMDDGLIASCKEANGELSWDDEEYPICDTWTIEKFFSFYNELWTFGEDLEGKILKGEVIFKDEMKIFASKILVLNEQSRNLRSCPTNSDEITMRTTALNRKWDVLQQYVSPEEHQDEKSTLKRDIACQMRFLRKWIRGMEIQLGPIYRKSEWTVEDIEVKLDHHRVVQKEIESREKNVLGVLKLCQRFEDLKEAEIGGWQRKDSTGGSGGSGCGGSGSGSAGSSNSNRDGNWIKRDFDHLQKRFHALWLHSLEWQYWLEGLLVSDPQCWGSLREDSSSSSSSGDEPNRKIPRLSGAFEGSKAGNRRKNSVGVALTGDSPPENGAEMVGMAGPNRPIDHHDVGYSSESSAHLSNEEGAGELRVYTYTSAEAKSPRVLEVVMDGDHRPRKTPPRDATPQKVSERGGAGGENNVEMSTVMQAGSNCATYYFRHDDSDMENKQRVPSGRKRLSFGSGSNRSGGDGEEDYDDDLSFGEMEEDEKEEEEYGQWSEELDKLVTGAEELVKVSKVSRECLTVTVDSSCDASGEYTTSSSSNNSSNESDSESTTDMIGSVIHLKDQQRLSANGSVASFKSDSGSSKQQQHTLVKMRSKKRRNGERPSSVVESSQSNFNLQHASFFTSESALNRLNSARIMKGGMALGNHFVDGGEGRPKRSPRRNSSRKSSLEAEGKCRSLGSLRHSSSSDNGRWKSNESSLIFEKLSSEEKESVIVSENGGRRRESFSSDSSINSDSHDEMSTVRADADLTLVQSPEHLTSDMEQAWDDYQEAPYLSEAYSESGVDDEAVKRLMEFGDDYQDFIGPNSSDGASTPSLYHASVKRPPNNCGFDSESDMEDMKDLLDQHTKMLSATKLQLQKMVLGECPKVHLKEVLASVQIHIKCLKEVWEQLLIPPHLNGPGHENRERLRVEWEKLVMQATEQEERLAQLGQLQNEATELERRIEATVGEVELWSNKVLRQEDVVEEAKNQTQKQLILLEQLNPTLIKLNFEIHSYVTRWQLDIVVLKNQVHALYRSWDKVKENIEKKLNWLESFGIAWNDYKVERNCMQTVLNEDRSVLSQLTQTIKCSPDLVHVARSSKTFMSNMTQIASLKEKLLKSSTSSSNSRSTLTAMNEAAARLMEILNDVKSEIGLKVSEELREASTEIEAQEQECKLMLNQLTTMLEEQDVFAQLNLNKNAKVVPPQKASSSKEDNLCSENVPLKKYVKPKKESLVWRVLRASLPFQLCVVILFCFACLFEPHCCDTLNNFNLSLAPQLRYLDGPPPV